MVQSLADWNEKFGENDQFVGSQSGGRFEFEQDVAYRVRVKSDKVVRTKRDEIQLELQLEVLDGDAVAGSTREWLTLPKQPTDEKLKAETVRKITLRRRDDLQRILSCSPDYSSTCAIWDDRTVEDGKVVHIKNGSVLDAPAFRAAEKAANLETMKVSDQCHEELELALNPQFSLGLEGTEFWLVKAKNASKPQYPYTNIYNVMPEKYPLFGE